MSETLTRLRLEGGQYEALLTAPTETVIEAVHQGAVVAVADCTPDPDGADRKMVRLSLPISVLSDGVQVIGLRSARTGAVLDRITLMAGTPLDEDLRAEIALLRDELELVKRAFLRHISDTAGH